jgi:hypothetical protein
MIANELNVVPNILEFSLYLLILRSSFFYQNGKSFLLEMAVIGEHFHQ